jgi:hypothetical protein
MKRAHEQGQSTVEFIFTFAFGVSIILMIFNSAMNYTAGYLLHYATFMASRVYLTADSYNRDVDDYQRVAEQRAREAYNRYNLDIFRIRSGNLILNHTSVNLPPNEYPTVGVVNSHEQRVDVLGRIAGDSTVSLISESFLGKEPTRAACARRVCKAMTDADDCSNFDVTLFDDGC